MEMRLEDLKKKKHPKSYEIGKEIQYHILFHHEEKKFRITEILASEWPEGEADFNLRPRKRMAGETVPFRFIPLSKSEKEEIAKIISNSPLTIKKMRHLAKDREEHILLT